MPSDLLAARGRDRLPMPAAGDFAADHRAGVRQQRKHELECRQQELLEQISERNTPAQRILMREAPRTGVAALFHSPGAEYHCGSNGSGARADARGAAAAFGECKDGNRGPRGSTRAFPCELELSSIPIAAPSMTMVAGVAVRSRQHLRALAKLAGPVRNPRGGVGTLSCERESLRSSGNSHGGERRCELSYLKQRIFAVAPGLYVDGRCGVAHTRVALI